MATTLVPRFAGRTITLAHSLRPTDRERPGRRLLNIAVATVGLVLALPLMLGIALLIKLTSRGPVLFKQTRVGLDRRALSRMGGNTPRPLEPAGHPYTKYKCPPRPAGNPEDEPPGGGHPRDTRVAPKGRAPPCPPGAPLP